MVSRTAKILVLILLIGFVLRIAPVLIYQTPINYDTPYHIRMASMIAESQGIPKIDPSLGGRFYSYPPIYHLQLVSFSHLTGFPIEFLALFFLPLISSIVVLSVFVLIRKISSDFNALFAAMLAAIAPYLITAAFDSPENIVFFLLPISLLCIYLKKEALGGFLFGFCLMCNYLAFGIALIPFFLAFRKNFKALKWGTIFIALFALLWLYMFGLNVLTQQSIQSGVSFVASNLSGVMLLFILMGAVIAIPILAFSFRQKISSEFSFFRFYLIISFLMLIGYLVIPFLRSWEQPKFLLFGAIMLIPALKKTKIVWQCLVLLTVFFLLFSFLSSFQVLYPKVTRLDFEAISFVESNYRGGKILAEPTFSETIMNKTNLDNALITALYYESISDPENNALANNGLRLLEKNGLPNEEQFVEDANISFVLLNFEDKEVREVKQFDSKKEFNKVFSLDYFGECPFWAFDITTGFACGQKETIVLQKN